MAAELIEEYRFDPIGVPQSTRLPAGDLIDLSEDFVLEAGSMVSEISDTEIEGELRTQAPS